MEKRRQRIQSIAFTYKAEDKILSYMKKQNITFNKAVNQIIEGEKNDNIK